mmetsp:Transcript_5102/g.11242  ORF Transcript_5102/g.11242 Transcript_5102/m.11242 type:complete len:89 (-) Transcript_5102:1025-1291(-)
MSTAQYLNDHDDFCQHEVVIFICDVSDNFDNLGLEVHFIGCTLTVDKNWPFAHFFSQHPHYESTQSPNGKQAIQRTTKHRIEALSTTP